MQAVSSPTNSSSDQPLVDFTGESQLVDFIRASQLGDQASLEGAYLKFTDDAVTYRGDDIR